MVEVADNFLEEPDFLRLQDIFMGVDIPWFYNDAIVYDEITDDRFQFTHMIYSNDQQDSGFLPEFDIVRDKLKSISLWRIKANLLTRTEKIRINDYHIDIGNIQDQPEKLKMWTTSIYYMNTNNGYTIFKDGTKVNSVANRMVTCPSDMEHTGTSCTDEKVRVVVNLNYFRG